MLSPDVYSQFGDVTPSHAEESDLTHHNIPTA